MPGVGARGHENKSAPDRKQQVKTSGKAIALVVGAEVGDMNVAPGKIQCAFQRHSQRIISFMVLPRTEKISASILIKSKTGYYPLVVSVRVVTLGNCY